MISNKIANNTEENVECMFKHVQKNVRIMRPKNELPSFRGKKDVNSEQKLHAGKSSMRNFGAAATLVLHGFFWRGIAHCFRLLSQDSYSRKNAEFHAKVCGIRKQIYAFLRESLRK